jgi:Cu+-exporting ATPase
MELDLAVVMDVAGTILRMYRVAKDIGRGVIMKQVVTWELIMEKSGRALVVPQMDPDIICSMRPEDPLATVVSGREDLVQVSCSSSRISKDRALQILSRSKAKVRDLQEVHHEVKARCPEKYRTAGMIVDDERNEVAFTLSTGGVPFPGFQEVLLDLRQMGADVYIASGDSMRSLSYLEELGIDMTRIYPVCSPRMKKQVVSDLKARYRQVVMVGDGLNDIYALQAADTGILTVQQDTRPAPRLREAADVVISDIKQLPKIVERGL